MPSTTLLKDAGWEVKDGVLTNVKTGERQAVAFVHQVAHEFQPRAELAARMQRLEVDGGKAFALEQRDGEAVAERELHEG